MSAGVRQVFVEMGFNYNARKLQVYTSDLQEQLIASAGAFYTMKSRMWMDEDSCPTYLEKAEKMMKEEKSR